MATAQEIAAGQVAYSKPLLSIYDGMVLGISNQFIWRCPTRKLLQHYNQHITSNHLDIGVGTGFFLDRCHFPRAPERLWLLDLNENSLSKTARRVVRYNPQVIQGNVLEPFVLDGPGFDSIGVNYLIHCLPGDMTSKGVLFDHIKPWLNAGGTVFGATLLQDGVKRSRIAQRLMEFYNRRGIFSNRQDSLGALDSLLSNRFERYELEVVGCAALFWAQ